MFKKQTFTIGSLFTLLALIGGLFLWPASTQAEQADFFKDSCKENECCLQYTSAMAAAEDDWNTHVHDLLAEPKPTSKKVSPAFDSLRTYDCWVRYICESVHVSGIVNPQSLEGGIRARNIGGAIPGCQAPENVQYGDNWNEFTTALDGGGDLISSINQPNKIAFLPACMTNPPENEKIDNQAFQTTELNYQNCIALAEVVLGCSNSNNEACKVSTPSALAGLEIALKKDHAQQRANALEQKLGDLNARVAVMKSVVSQVKTFLSALEQRYECAPFTKCT